MVLAQLWPSLGLRSLGKPLLQAFLVLEFIIIHTDSVRWQMRLYSQLFIYLFYCFATVGVSYQQVLDLLADVKNLGHVLALI